jgi:DNA polymerase III epsilon subunit-like protein
VTKKIVFVDTETTSLRPDRRAWDVALIVREPGRPDAEYQWFVHHEDLDLANADPKSLQVSRFYERHPYMNGSSDAWTPGDSAEVVVMHEVEHLTRGAHLVAAVPSFDAEVLAARMRAHGLLPAWHHHLIDVGALAAGCTAGSGLWPRTSVDVLDVLPWSTTHLGELLDVPTPAEIDRHTALGDARYARDLFDAVMPGGPTEPHEDDDAEAAG